MTNEQYGAAPIIDSRMTFREAINGTKAPTEVVRDLCLLDVRYYSFDGMLHQGQLVVHKDIKADVVEIFRLIERLRFPVNKAVPIVAYGWSDDASMADNNASAFNYRTVAGTKRLSRHACGLAVDINPFRNPVVYNSGRISPQGAVYRPGDPGVLTTGHPVVEEFLKRGWQWGANFKSMKDYHHFDKIMAR
jgi:peptidoglycan L-alanyl-D-glutamate endopeptidase CwlK